jgi:hypothetical protein
MNYDHNNNHNDDDDDEEEEDTQCGIWRFKPAPLQYCAKVGVFTGVYSLVGLLTQTLTTYVSSQVRHNYVSF